MGQRQKIVRKRRNDQRRDVLQKIGAAQSVRHRRHRRRPVQGHVWPVDEYSHQVDVYCVVDYRPLYFWDWSMKQGSDFVQKKDRGQRSFFFVQLIMQLMVSEYLKVSKNKVIRQKFELR